MEKTTLVEGVAGYFLVSSDQLENNKPTSRAVSAFSSSAPCLKMLTGAIDKDACVETIKTISPSINQSISTSHFIDLNLEEVNNVKFLSL